MSKLSYSTAAAAALHGSSSSGSSSGGPHYNARTSRVAPQRHLAYRYATRVTGSDSYALLFLLLLEVKILILILIT